LEAYFTGNLTTLFLAGSAATLSRETGVLVLGALLCVSLWDGLGSKVHPRQLVTLAVGASALLPFFLWQATLSHVYRQSAMSSDVAANLGWPFEGVISTVWEALAGTRFYVHSSALQLAMRGFVVVSAPFLLYLCSLVAWRLYAVLRDASFRAVGAVWMPLAMLMMLLTGGGGPLGRSRVVPSRVFRVLRHWRSDCRLAAYVLLAHQGLRCWRIVNVRRRLGNLLHGTA
jgi:hypothetical protein